MNNWKPIEELIEEVLKESIESESIQILLFKCCLYYLADITNTLHLYGIEVNGVKRSMEWVKHNFTHYALPTPPKTNQSNK